MLVEKIISSKYLLICLGKCFSIILEKTGKIEIGLQFSGSHIIIIIIIIIIIVIITDSINNPTKYKIFRLYLELFPNSFHIVR